jgi:oligopeptide/dipeptide ABC transporter ATP-binding protein
MTDDATDERPADAATGDPLLTVEDLRVRFETSEETVHAVNGVDFAIDRGETLGLVGESGSGKSVTALSALGLLDDTARVAGTVDFDGEALLEKPDGEIRSLRGDRISMVFQDPGSSLNPVLSVGDQISETIRTHQAPAGEGISRFERSVLGNLVRPKDAFAKQTQSWETTVDLFERVSIPLPEQRALEYPHEFSGGMKQRALIAMAVSCQPDLLICDEPTTALDVTIEAQILDLIEELQREFGTAVLFITHDLGVVREVCDRVSVMYAGNVVEHGPTETLFETPSHPYTRALLDSVPRLDTDADLDPVAGRVPDMTSEPAGCPFAPRCTYENDACHDTFPPAYPVDADSKQLPVRSRDPADEDEAVTSPPPVAATLSAADTDGHVANCVLYGDGEYLTAPRPASEIPAAVRAVDPSDGSPSEEPGVRGDDR